MADREDKKRRKKARGLLLGFLKNLQKKCGTFATADEWFEFIKSGLNPILDKFSDTLTPEWREKLNKAAELTDTTKEAVNNSCKLLQKEIKGIAKNLPAGSFLSSPAVITVLVGTVIVAGATVILNMIAVTVNIRNNGCQTIYPAVYLPVKIPGLELPDQPIVNGGQASAKIPPVKFTVTAGVERIDLQAFSMNFGFELGSSGIDLVFDGQSLMNRSALLDLGSQKIHNLIVNCR